MKIKNSVKIKTLKKRDINKKRKKRFYIYDQDDVDLCAVSNRVRVTVELGLG